MHELIIYCIPFLPQFVLVIVLVHKLQLVMHLDLSEPKRGTDVGFCPCYELLCKQIQLTRALLLNFSVTLKPSKVRESVQLEHKI